MAPKKFARDELSAFLPADGLCLLSGCSAESALFDDAIIAAGDAVAGTTFTGIFMPGYNKCRWLANSHSRALAFFMTPEFRAAGSDRVDFRPLRYADILSLLRRSRPKAALFMVSPPDANGVCSFGTAVDFIPELWHQTPVRIAHINPLMPATAGNPGIPFSELTAWCEAPQPLLEHNEKATDAVTAAIASHIIPLVRDGATLQIGFGQIPGAILRGLTSHRNLRFHSGLVPDAIVDLLEAGAMADGTPITAGVAIGSQRLYDVVGSDAFAFHPVSVTHGLDSLRVINDLVAINSAIEVDLFGQAHAELTPKGLMSGPGGATDFAQGTRAANGLRVIAFPSTAANGKISRVVPAGQGAGPVSLSRSDIDIVVTEHGAADLRDCGYEARAKALIAIADPAHRDALAASWAEVRHRL